jgi:hypothetical protein
MRISRIPVFLCGWNWLPVNPRTSSFCGKTEETARAGEAISLHRPVMVMLALLRISLAEVVPAGARKNVLPDFKQRPCGAAPHSGE